MSATCSASPQAGDAPLSVRFVVVAQGGIGQYTYAWTFGDGQTATVPNPTHVYVTAGDYTPAVQVSSGFDSFTCPLNVQVAAKAHRLDVSLQGPGSGSVTSSPAGIACGSTCSTEFPRGTVVTLTAQADPGSVFKQWLEVCSGAGACIVTMDSTRHVTAQFDLVTSMVSLAKGPPPLTVGRDRPEGPGAEVEVGLFRSSLRVPKGRGEVTFGGRVVLVTGEGEASFGARAQLGNNLVEAFSREETRGGLWRFDFPVTALQAGLRVISGDAVATSPDSVTFRLSGRAGERLSFVFRVSGSLLTSEPRSGPASP